jgi:hypothetical protein
MKRLNGIKPKPGFVYIMSNVRYKGRIKIGQTQNDPEIRALQFTKSTGQIGEFIVEWSRKVSHMDLAEGLLHNKFSAFHDDGEYFKFPVKPAVKIANSVLRVFDQEISPEKKLVKTKQAKRGQESASKKIIAGWRKIKQGKPKFIGTAIDLLLKEGRSASPFRIVKAFMAIRSDKVTGIGYISFYIQKNHIRVYITCGRELKEKARRKVNAQFKYYNVAIPELSEWKNGISFLASNPEEFKVLKKWLGLGSKARR